MYLKNLETFLHTNNIDQDTWQKSALEWGMLEKIAKDHESQISYLTDSAEFFARVIQRFDSVHSVRWRVKSTDHLLAKIVRKKCEKSEKYADIDETNYFEKITDLVGLRALHLFKDDCFSIDASLQKTWELSEKATAYIRQGDPRKKFEDASFEIKEHKAGYRSVHYICETKPLNRIVYTEVQVRTIFEEGWSEIDHRVRYPSFSNNEHVNYFLTIFNRLAGSADEMGTFVQQLTGLVSESNAKILEANKARDQAFSEMHDLLQNLENMKEKDTKATSTIAALQSQLEKMQKMSSSFGSIFENKYGGTKPALLAAQAFAEQQENSRIAAIRSLARLNDPETHWFDTKNTP